MLKYRCLAVITIVVSLTLPGCAVFRDTPQTEAYNQFAIRAARAQLWNEAIFRWKQVINMDPDDSKAHNNLGVAYEAIGSMDAALTAYQRAAELDPDNRYYRLNYRRCRIHLRRRGGDNGHTPLMEVEENEFSSTEE